MITRITHQDKELAIIIRNSFHKDGIEFFTPSFYSQQIGYMNHPVGHVISPHLHNPVTRQVQFTKEVLFIKSGRVRVDFYDDEQNYLESRILNQGDIILLAFGGHGFEMLESSEIIEVKQGPYAGDADKIRFTGVLSDKLRIL
jgi:mannose-6-phosphate isomerase-like protein (cupin superfamily)